MCSLRPPAAILVPAAPGGAGLAAPGAVRGAASALLLRLAVPVVSGGELGTLRERVLFEGGGGGGKGWKAEQSGPGAGGRSPAVSSCFAWRVGREGAGGILT